MPETFNKITTITGMDDITDIALMNCITIGGIPLSTIFFDAAGARRNPAGISEYLLDPAGANAVAANAHVIIRVQGTTLPPAAIAPAVVAPLFSDVGDAAAAAATVVGTPELIGLNMMNVTAVVKVADAAAIAPVHDNIEMAGGGAESTIVQNGIEFKVEGGGNKPLVGGGALEFSKYGNESHIVTGYDKSISAAGSIGNGLHPSILRGGGGCGIAAQQMGSRVTSMNTLRGGVTPLKGGRRNTKKGKKKVSAKKHAK